jgi:hypothetical protein
MHASAILPSFHCFPLFCVPRMVQGAGEGCWATFALVVAGCGGAMRGNSRKMGVSGILILFRRFPLFHDALRVQDAGGGYWPAVGPAICGYICRGLAKNGKTRKIRISGVSLFSSCSGHVT